MFSKNSQVNLQESQSNRVYPNRNLNELVVESPNYQKRQLINTQQYRQRNYKSFLFLN